MSRAATPATVGEAMLVPLFATILAAAPAATGRVDPDARGHDLRRQTPVRRGSMAAEPRDVATVQSRAHGEGAFGGPIIGKATDARVRLCNNVELAVSPHNGVELTFPCFPSGKRPGALLLRLMLTIKGLTRDRESALLRHTRSLRTGSPSPEGFLSVAPEPRELTSTLAKRMCLTAGAMPANRGWTYPLPAMVPVTWVPWPNSSIHRSSASRNAPSGPNQRLPHTKLAPQMLSRLEAMSK